VGQDRLVDNANKTIHPLAVPTSLSPLHVTNRVTSDLGFLPIGVYKGQAAFWDLDKAVNQPLVEAEQQHILGILDGREADYDLLTLTTVVGATSPIGTVLTDTLTVPAGLVFFISGVLTNVNAVGAANGLVGNWRCSLWPSREDPAHSAGQSFHPAAGLIAAAGALTTTADEFGPWAPALALGNKVPLLRLPAGAKITFTVTTTTAQVNVATASTLQLFGTVGKLLVA